MKARFLKSPQIIGVVVLFLFAAIFGVLRSKEFEKSGLITVCKIIKLEGSGDGADLYLEVYFRKKRYSVIVNDFCMSCVGDFRYCKVLLENEKDVILLDEQVPACIVNSLPIYDSGWLTIPLDTCVKK